MHGHKKLKSARLLELAGAHRGVVQRGLVGEWNIFPRLVEVARHSRVDFEAVRCDSRRRGRRASLAHSNKVANILHEGDTAHTRGSWGLNNDLAGGRRATAEFDVELHHIPDVFGVRNVKHATRGHLEHWSGLSLEIGEARCRAHAWAHISCCCGCHANQESDNRCEEGKLHCVFCCFHANDVAWVCISENSTLLMFVLSKDRELQLFICTTLHNGTMQNRCAAWPYKFSASEPARFFGDVRRETAHKRSGSFSLHCSVKSFAH